MQQRREVFLNSLLAVLVLTSILLSARLLYLPDETDSASGEDAEVAAPPPDGQGEMPDVYRPERILVQTRTDTGALLLPGSESYRATWDVVLSVLEDLAPDWSAAETQADQAVAPSITVMLPMPAPLDQWARYWGWDAPDASLGEMWVDRIRLLLGEDVQVLLSGPAGEACWIGTLSSDQQEQIQQQVAQLSNSLFSAYRPVQLEDESVYLLPGLTVPAVDAVPWARISVQTPDPMWEKSRYFPDLSVVRQIDEANADSYTDGQRLLRILSSGILEYRTADLDGVGPDVQQALDLVAGWVGARGGWVSDLVLTGWTQEEDETLLTFEDRVQGPLPVETTGGALQIRVKVDAANSDLARVTFLYCYPELLPAFDPEVSLSVITPEAALQIALTRYPKVLESSTVRDMYLAYLVQPGAHPGDVGWQIEPFWVIQAAGTRLYIPALSDSALEPVQADSPYHPAEE